MDTGTATFRPLVVVGGGIGGLAAALALARNGHAVTLLEQSAELGEIGAGIQLAPNAFAALDALGIGERVRRHAVFVERLVLMDAIDESVVADVPLGDAFRARFGNPYAVIHRTDIHAAILGAVRETERIELKTATRAVALEIAADGVVVVDQHGERHRGAAVVGCDGVKSVVREHLVGDAHRVSGHVVYRGVVLAEDMPADLAWNSPVVWCGPDCHLVHYPLRGGAQYNLVLTFHSRETETWGVREGSREEVMSYFHGVATRPRRLLELPTSWKRWSTADRDPVAAWGRGPATLLGDAAHPMLQYLAQGACMALEDAVTLGSALAPHGDDLEAGFRAYEQARIARTARLVLSAREMGRVYHAKGVERLVRNSLWRDRPPERAYDSLAWLFGWSAERCLAT